MNAPDAEAPGAEGAGARAASAAVPRIVLIGFMGSGKTTVGRIVARSLGREFVDTDALVEKAAGKSVARIFAEDGESAFRAAEAEALRSLGQRAGIVVATGGGAPAQARNAWFFAGNAVTFHLRVPFADVLRRAGRTEERPLLQQPDAEVRKLFDLRFPVYESLGAGVDTQDRSPKEVAADIIRMLAHPTESPGPVGGA